MTAIIPVMGPVMGSVLRGPFEGNTDPDALLWYNAVFANGGTVSAGRLAVVSTFIAADKASGAWALTDDIWGLWAENAVQALTSLKQRRLATAVNSPTFTADRDYTFDGVTQYIDTGFVPGTHGINLTGTDQRIGVYERTDVSSGGSSAGVFIGSSTNLYILSRNSGTMQTRLNSGTANFVLAVADSRGLKVSSRAGGTTALGYDRGVRLTDITGLSIGSSPSTSSMYIGCRNGAGTPTTFRPASIGFVVAGGPLSDAQELAQYNAMQAWATAVGAQV